MPVNERDLTARSIRNPNRQPLIDAGVEIVRPPPDFVSYVS
jgi:hypothetical protein